MRIWKRKEIEKNDSSNIQNLLNETLVGIDFGSAYSGFAFIINLRNKNNKIEYEDKNKYLTFIIIQRKQSKIL